MNEERLMAAQEEVQVGLVEGEDFVVMNVSTRHTRELHASLTQLFCARRQGPPFNELSQCVSCGASNFLMKLHAVSCTHCGDGVVEITWLPSSAEQEMLHLLRSGGALHVAMSMDREAQEILGFIQTVPCGMTGLNALIGVNVMGDIVRRLGRHARYVYVTTSAVKDGSAGLGVEQILLERALKHWDKGPGIPLLVRVESGSCEEAWYQGLGLKTYSRLPDQGGYIMGRVLRVR